MLNAICMMCTCIVFWFLFCRELFFRQLTHVRLDRLRIAALPLDVLSQLPAVTHLYLQHNRLVAMGGVSELPALQFLTLSHNRIAEVRARWGLGCLGLHEGFRAYKRGLQGAGHDCWGPPEHTECV